MPRTAVSAAIATTVVLDGTVRVVWGAERVRVAVIAEAFRVEASSVPGDPGG
jgi:hypothetical protein